MKRENKRDLGLILKDRTGIVVDPDSLFDIQVKRLHEYKRQHLNVLHVITLYNRLKKNSNLVITPRTVIFGGKAAPGYFMAKLIIKLINSVARRSTMTRMWPAASTWRFSLISISRTATTSTRLLISPNRFPPQARKHQEEVYDLKGKGYNPWPYYEGNSELREAIDLIRSGFFSDGDSDLFKPFVDALLYHDEYLVFADYPSYVESQEQVSQAYRDQERWTRMSILNVARMCKFSSDRSIREYCDKIWKVEPVPVFLK